MSDRFSVTRSQVPFAALARQLDLPFSFGEASELLLSYLVVTFRAAPARYETYVSGFLDGKRLPAPVAHVVAA
jgi:hypothetical protein